VFKTPSGSPIEAGMTIDMGLIGLLTYALDQKKPSSKTAYHLIFSDYSCGAVADSHRASRASDREIYSRVLWQSQAGRNVKKNRGERVGLNQQVCIRY
jgi:hypothetical protein